MAEQSISLKSTESDAGNSRRHSLGKATSSRSDEKVPNYLRASTGSCHDFCKFGREHAFEEKARRPFTRRNAKKLHGGHSSELQPEIIIKTANVPRGTSSTSKTPPDTHEIIKREVHKKPLDRKSSSVNVVVDEKKTPLRASLTKSVDRQILTKKKTMVKDVLTKSVDRQISVSSDNWAEKRKIPLRERNKSSVANLNTSPDSKSIKIIKPGVLLSSEKLEVSLKQISSEVKKGNISAKHAHSLKVKSPSSDSSRVASIRGNSNNKIAQKTLTSRIAIKRVQTTPRAVLSPKTTSSGNARGVASPRVSSFIKPTVRVSMPPRASLSFRPSLSRVASLNARRHRTSEVVSPLKKQSKINKASNKHPKIKNADHEQTIKEHNGPGSDVVQEKTLYVIKADSKNNYLVSDREENPSAESSPPPLSSAKYQSQPEVPLSYSNNEEGEEESDYSGSEDEDYSLSEYEETEYMEEANNAEGERKRWLRKSGMLPPEDTNDQPVKLRFRRGKVIDVKTEHNRPMRLKFRQGRVLGENQNLKSESRRSFKRRGAEELTKDNPDSEKVVLRHQDVHGKKDAQGLFNNVIEETASKLAETRKSKVKALVGAFETVISLQDSKPPVSSAS
ncbi:uncharacterized protein LOC126677990 [Mercurialis annua]|uniref:uncharacterized protein LOC126677990 n=1 Tax=Mercurialis annua TaxID=3986 RepID=UPI00215F5CE1|nr:uncharacterized protein LOC126677990 [Mercurialis annua]XP_050228778.1 uncharacterized protein LOC126677990 [Mercurialis annua]